MNKCPVSCPHNFNTNEKSNIKAYLIYLQAANLENKLARKYGSHTFDDTENLIVTAGHHIFSMHTHVEPTRALLVLMAIFYTFDLNYQRGSESCSCRQNFWMIQIGNQNSFNKEFKAYQKFVQQRNYVRMCGN